MVLRRHRLQLQIAHYELVWVGPKICTYSPSSCTAHMCIVKHLGMFEGGELLVPSKMTESSVQWYLIVQNVCLAIGVLRQPNCEILTFLCLVVAAGTKPNLELSYTELEEPQYQMWITCAFFMVFIFVLMKKDGFKEIDDDVTFQEVPKNSNGKESWIFV